MKLREGRYLVWVWMWEGEVGFWGRLRVGGMVCW